MITPQSLINGSTYQRPEGRPTSQPSSGKGVSMGGGEVYNRDPNANLLEATILGNEMNTAALGQYGGLANQLTNQYNQNTGGLIGTTNDLMNQSLGMYSQGLGNAYGDYANQMQGSTGRYGQGLQGALGQYGQSLQGAYDKYNQGLSGAFGGYDQRSRNLLGKMGTTDKDTHARYKGQHYAGLDTGFGEASDDLQSSLARRGMSSSGVGAKAMGDLSQDRMRAGAQAGVSAHEGAINRSDITRGQQLAGEDRLYGAETSNLGNLFGAGVGNANSLFGNTAQSLGSTYGAESGMNTGLYGARTGNIGNIYGAQQGNIMGNYGRNVGQLGQQYSTGMAVGGQNLQNEINNNQQRIANLMGYAQLGRGMSGQAANYLGQAGTGYGNIGQMAGSTALGLGQNQNAYNSTMQRANTASNAKGGEMLGGGLGMLGSATKLW